MRRARAWKKAAAALALCLMALTAAIPAAFADEEAYPVMVGGVQVTSANATDVLADGSVRAEYDATAGRMTLYLTDAQIPIESAQTIYGTSGDAAGICSDGTNLVINLSGKSRIFGQPTDAGLAYLQGICTTDCDVLIEGSGSLTIDVLDDSDTGYTILAGIYASRGDVQFGNDGGTVSITCKSTVPPDFTHGICVPDGSFEAGAMNVSMDIGPANDASLGFETDSDIIFANTMVTVVTGHATYSCCIHAHKGDVDISDLSILDLRAGSATNESSGITIGNVRRDGVHIHGDSVATIIASNDAPAGFGINSDLTTVEDTGALTALGTTRAIFWDLDLTRHTYCDAVANLEYDEEPAHASRPEPGTLLATEESFFKSVFIRPGNAVGMRLAGETANETSAAIATFTFGDNKPRRADCEYVVIARDDDFADALGATGLAGVLHCPIVLTDRTALSPAAANAIKSMGPKKAYLIGGEGAMKPQLVNDLAAQCGITDVTRLWGEDCYDTSLACAEEIARIQPPETAIAAMSMNFQDALSISPVAYSQGLPVVLQTWGDTAVDRGFTDEAHSFLADKDLLVIGGTGAISEESLAGLHATERLWGETGYDTSLAIAKWGIQTGALSPVNIVIACGAQAPRGVDALAGSALAGTLKAPILLVNANPEIEEPDTTCTDALPLSSSQKLLRVFVLGGAYVVPQGFYEGLLAQADAEEVDTAHLCDLMFQGAFDEP